MTDKNTMQFIYEDEKLSDGSEVCNLVLLINNQGYVSEQRKIVFHTVDFEKGIELKKTINRLAVDVEITV